MFETVEDPMADIYESFAERQIRRAQEDGLFDALPGMGEPLPDLDGTYDPAWWAKKWVDRQRRLDRAHAAVRDAHARLGRVWPLEDEAEVRRTVGALNAAIVAASEGLPEADRPDLIDPEEVVATWRAMAPARRRWR